LYESLDAPEVLFYFVEPIVRNPREALIPTVKVALELVERLMNFDGVGQEVHILPCLAIFVYAPDASCESLVLVLGQDSSYVVVEGKRLNFYESMILSGLLR
jgi:hypothetical protein